jgi:choline dehydrogenase-like flavoprotein
MTTPGSDVFDLIVVGAGPGGCATAARVAEARPDWRIALLESGPARGNLLVSTPAGLIGLVDAANCHNYLYASTPQSELGGRQAVQPRGRGVGGSSLINAMVYIRGQPEDYDSWAAAGCPGWSWDDVLPLFRRSEDNVRGTDALHGVGGPLHVDDQWSDTPASQVFLRAAQQAGHRLNLDFNGSVQEGVGLYQLFQKNGRRYDAGTAYIHTRPRPNLAVLADTQALRVEITDGRATGVRVRAKDGERTIIARREVILAAGTFGTPQILMLSGIGPGDHLQDRGIPVVADRRGVGCNLQDHLDHISVRTLKGSGVVGPTAAGALTLARGLLPFLRGGRGVLSSNLAEGGGFLRSSPKVDRPDLQLHFLIGLIEEPGGKPSGLTGVSLHVCALRPHSRGTVRLATSNPSDAPLIDPAYLSDPRDLPDLVRGVRLAESILNQPAFVRAGATRASWMNLDDDAAIIDSIRRRAGTIYHPVGTCRMGSDPGSVVDPELRVRGVLGLRIADASIMPTLISGNTQAPTAMIGERASDLILRASQ